MRRAPRRRVLRHFPDGRTLRRALRRARARGFSTVMCWSETSGSVVERHSMTRLNRRLGMAAVAVLALWLTDGLRGAYSLRIAPDNPTIQVGDTVQFAADGGLSPSIVADG